MKKTKKVYIWWVSQEACKIMGGKPIVDFPRYLRDQYISRFGRPGRCRLWVDDRVCGDVGINPWPFNLFTEWLEEEDCGGIAVLEKDLHLLKDLPGIVTDLKLERVG